MKAVSDGLERLEGVRSIEVDLQRNVVTIRPEDGAELDLAAIPRRVHESGFAPGEMRLAARGTFERGDGGLVFRIAGWQRSYPVTGTGREGPGHAEVLVHYGDDGVRFILGPR